MDPRPFTGPLRVAALALLAAASPGCGGGEELAGHPHLVRDLLAGGPDEVVEQHGVLHPDPDRQWVPHGRAGWLLYTDEYAPGAFSVWCDRPVARLEFSAFEPADRTLSVLCWIAPAADPEAPEEERVTVRLNGVAVGEGTVGLGPTRIEVEVPAAVWRAGTNALELDLGGVRETPGGESLGLAVAEVRYDRPSLVDAEPAERRLVLQPGNRVRYLVEHPADDPGGLELELRGRGRGTVEVAFTALDPTTGLAPGEPDAVLAVGTDGSQLAARLPLPATGGRVLQTELRWLGEGDSGLELEALGLYGLRRPELTPVLFISIDTLAAEHMSVYGYGRRTTPELERFAQDAVVFERCAANAPWTLPSYMSVMTGLHAFAHYREFDWGTGFRPELWDTWELATNRWTLAEMLRARGYRTAGFVDNLWLTDKFNFPQGFEVFDFSAGEIPREDPEGGIRHVLPLADAWLDALAPGEPYFLFLHAFDVHGPYLPQPPYAGTFTGDPLFDAEHRAPAGGMEKAFGSIPVYIARGVVPEGEIPTELATGPIHADYDEEILALDAELGRYFDSLKARGLYDPALIVLTADHGETTVDHDFYFGHGVVWEDVARVPLMVKLPGNERGGTRIAGSVQLVDLMPTLMDLVGLDPERPGLHGRSLLPALQGEPLAPRPTFTQGGVMAQAAVELGGWKLIELRPADQSSIQTMITSPFLDREWRQGLLPELGGSVLTYEVFDRILERLPKRQIAPVLKAELQGVRHELYYLPDDPDERVNLAAEHPDRVAELARHLRVLEEEVSIAQGRARSSATVVEFSEEELTELGKLGYTDVR